MRDTAVMIRRTEPMTEGRGSQRSGVVFLCTGSANEPWRVTRSLELSSDQELVDIAARYAASLDDGDFGGVAALFSDDGQLVVGDAEQPTVIRGREQIEQFYRSALTMPTQHAIVGVTCEAGEGDEIRMRVACRAHHLMAEDTVIVFAVTYRDIVSAGRPHLIRRRSVEVAWREQQRRDIAAAGRD